MTKILFYMSTTLKEYLLNCFILVILLFILSYICNKSVPLVFNLNGKAFSIPLLD
jgi:hypothetical protein